jgi:hypothetical protein
MVQIMNYNINSGGLRFFFFFIFFHLLRNRVVSRFSLSRVSRLFILFAIAWVFFFTHFGMVILWPYLGGGSFWLARALTPILALTPT